MLNIIHTASNSLVDANIQRKPGNSKSTVIAVSWRFLLTVSFTQDHYPHLRDHTEPQCKQMILASPRIGHSDSLSDGQAVIPLPVRFRNAPIQFHPVAEQFLKNSGSDPVSER